MHRHMDPATFLSFSLKRDLHVIEVGTISFNEDSNIVDM